MIVAKPKKPTNPWPARLKAVQERLGLSNAQVAVKLGILERTWISWKYGERRPGPGAEKLISLLEAGKL